VIIICLHKNFILLLSAAEKHRMERFRAATACAHEILQELHRAFARRTG
jgi:hypothetical protein